MIKSGHSKVQFKYTKIFFIDCLLHVGRQCTKIYINDYSYYSKSKLLFSKIYDIIICRTYNIMILSHRFVKLKWGEKSLSEKPVYMYVSKINQCSIKAKVVIQTDLHVSKHSNIIQQVIRYLNILFMEDECYLNEMFTVIWSSMHN